MDEQEKRKNREEMERLIAKGESGISKGKPKPKPTSKAKEASRRQMQSRRKVPDQMKRIVRAHGLPTGRNDGPESAKIAADLAEVFPVVKLPDSSFDLACGALLDGLKRSHRHEVPLSIFWGVILDFLSESLGSRHRSLEYLRANKDRLLQRLANLLEGWCRGWSQGRHGDVRIIGYRGQNDATLIQAEGRIHPKGTTWRGGSDPQIRFGLPALLKPGEMWNGGRISDEVGPTLVNARFRGFYPATLRAVKNEHDPRFLIKWEKRRRSRRKN